MTQTTITSTKEFQDRVGNGIQLEPETNIYLDIKKNTTELSDVILNVKTVWKSDIK